MDIGILGLGKMGTAIAQRLMECGHSVSVWNRTAEKCKPLAEAGAVAAANPRELADRSEAIISILTDAAAVDAVLSGDNGVLAAKLDGKLFIEMSTIQPADQEKLAARVRARGGRYVECAVSGTVGPARQGRLVGLAGAEDADLAAATPVLEQLCRRIAHAGPAGAGASVKLAVNLPLMLYYQALGEAYSLCRHLDRDANWLIDLMADTSGGPNILKARGPVIAAALEGTDPLPVSFDVDGLRKDLRTMIAEGQARGTSLPLAERALAVYDQASAEGWGKRDGNTLPRYWSSRTAG
jgi:3-hydroxyisobutyrate dehydrogenase